jgi:hypothetical protein
LGVRAVIRNGSSVDSSLGGRCMSRSMLLYDGDCGFCTSCARWIEHRWPEGAAQLAIPWQLLGEDAMAATGLTEADFARSVWWVAAKGWWRLGRSRPGAAHPTDLLGGSPRLSTGRSLSTPAPRWDTCLQDACGGVTPRTVAGGDPSVRCSSSAPQVAPLHLGDPRGGVVDPPADDHLG